MHQNEWNKLHEECGVFGVFSPTQQDVALQTYYGFVLVHCSTVVRKVRALWSTITVCLRHYKDTGLVNDVFTPEVLQTLGEGNMAVGHVRYGTHRHQRPTECTADCRESYQGQSCAGTQWQPDQFHRVAPRIGITRFHLSYDQ